MYFVSTNTLKDQSFRTFSRYVQLGGISNRTVFNKPMCTTNNTNTSRPLEFLENERLVYSLLRNKYFARGLNRLRNCPTISNVFPVIIFDVYFKRTRVDCNKTYYFRRSGGSTGVTEATRQEIGGKIFSSKHVRVRFFRLNSNNGR